MSLEDRIKALEQQLAIKHAYLSAKVVFGNKGKNIPADVKKTVEKSIKELCAQLAEGNEVSQPNSSGLTTQEVNVLKSLASKVLSKTGAKITSTAQTKKARTLKDVLSNASKSNITAQILLLDSVPATLRKKVDAQSIVKILANKGDRVFVETERGVRFYLPIEDVDFNYNDKDNEETE